MFQLKQGMTYLLSCLYNKPGYSNCVRKCINLNYYSFFFINNILANKVEGKLTTGDFSCQVGHCIIH